MADSPAGSRTLELATFLAQLPASIDERLIERSATHLLDTLGCMAFGAEQPWSRAAAGHALATGAAGSSTVIGADAKTTPPMAAFANGAAAHGFELDDVHEESISHPGAVVIPTALALADEIDASATELLGAIVVGYEAMGRAGIAVGPASHMLGGFHPTSMSGVFGAAAAAGALLRFDAGQMNSAFGIAASMASGTMEFAASGGMAKRIHAARAAEGGTTAALLVARGLEGSADGLAGTYGFCNIFTSEPRVELLTEELGERWMMDEITIKPYAACSDIHPMIQATIELRHEHGLTPDTIASIEAFGPTKAATQNSLDGTVSVMAAQYSAQWNIAAALLADPTDPETFAVDRIDTPEIRSLQSKIVAVDADPEYDATYAWKMGGGVRIVLTDGTRLERAVHGQKGSMHDPMSPDEVRSKFDRLISREQGADIATVVLESPRSGLSTRDLTASVASPRSQA